MAAFQVPRFVKFVDSFPEDTDRAYQKQFLSKSIDDCWDKEK